MVIEKLPPMQIGPAETQNDRNGSRQKSNFSLYKGSFCDRIARPVLTCFH